MIRNIILAIGLVTIFSLLLFAQREMVPDNPKEQTKSVIPETEKNIVTKKRQREGTVFQGLKVTFRPTGNRTTLFPTENNDERFVCLENLQLERILKIIEEKPHRTLWKIDGIYTEFRGENYVLIQRAVSVM